MFLEDGQIDLDFEEVWLRVQEATGLTKLTQLGKILNVKQPSVSRAKKDGRFPAQWALSIARGYFLNSDWVLYGKGPKHYGNLHTKKIIAKLQRLKKVIEQAANATTIEEYEVCLEVAEKLRNELNEPLSINKKAELADARIVELEEEVEQLEVENLALKRALEFDSTPEIKDLIEKARRVLTSGNPVAFDALERNIRYFDHAIAAEKRADEAERKIRGMEEDVKMIKDELTRLKRENLRLDTEAEEQSLKKKAG